MRRALAGAAMVTAAAAVACAAACGGARQRAPQRPAVRVAYRFECIPRDARVIVDEIDQGACIVWERQFLGLADGTHRLRVEREGYLPFERELPATGRRETVRVELREQPE